MISQRTNNAELARSLFGASVLYGAVGGVLLSSPLLAAGYGLVSVLATRNIHWFLNKTPFAQDSIIGKTALLATSCFLATAAASGLAHLAGFSVTIATGLILHAAVLATIAAVALIALPFLFCTGTIIGVRLLPSS